MLEGTRSGLGVPAEWALPATRAEAGFLFSRQLCLSAAAHWLTLFIFAVSVFCGFLHFQYLE